MEFYLGFCIVDYDTKQRIKPLANNPSQVRSKRCSKNKKNLMSISYFNPSQVRSKLSRLMMICIRNLNFNPSQVRSKQRETAHHGLLRRYFNPSQVRSKRGVRYEVCVLRLYFNPSQVRSKLKSDIESAIEYPSFQSLIGKIKTVLLQAL